MHVEQGIRSGKKKQNDNKSNNNNNNNNVKIQKI